jgi:Ran GTPase-activating protein (RanGAP) involved in mRNA processing and transport
MHATNAGEKRKALQREALELARDAKAMMKAAKTLPDARQKVRELQGEADTARAEALALKPLARLEDLHVWQMEKVKTTKKGSRKYAYWMATWRRGGKTRNVHLGSCGKMEEETTLQKARAMKAEALAIKL